MIWQVKYTQWKSHQAYVTTAYLVVCCVDSHCANTELMCEWHTLVCVGACYASAALSLLSQRAMSQQLIGASCNAHAFSLKSALHLSVCLSDRHCLCAWQTLPMSGRVKSDVLAAYRCGAHCLKPTVSCPVCHGLSFNVFVPACCSYISSTFKILFLNDWKGFPGDWFKSMAG